LRSIATIISGTIRAWIDDKYAGFPMSPAAKGPMRTTYGGSIAALISIVLVRL
jgi:hypothetical protein